MGDRAGVTSSRSCSEWNAWWYLREGHHRWQGRKIQLVTHRAPLQAHSLPGVALTHLISLSQSLDLETEKLNLTEAIPGICSQRPRPGRART